MSTTADVSVKEKRRKEGIRDTRNIYNTNGAVIPERETVCWRQKSKKSIAFEESSPKRKRGTLSFESR
jgi:hypothetical protein